MISAIHSLKWVYWERMDKSFHHWQILKSLLKLLFEKLKSCLFLLTDVIIWLRCSCLINSTKTLGTRKNTEISFHIASKVHVSSDLYLPHSQIAGQGLRNNEKKIYIHLLKFTYSHKIWKLTISQFVNAQSPVHTNLCWWRVNGAAASS